MLSALISTLHNKNTPSAQQPVLVVVQNTMPLYRLIGEKYCNNLEVIDVCQMNYMYVFKSANCCMFQVLSSLFKHVLTTLMDDCKPLINDILQIVVSIYREVPQASVLVVAKTVIVPYHLCQTLFYILHYLKKLNHCLALTYFLPTNFFYIECSGQQNKIYSKNCIVALQCRLLYRVFTWCLKRQIFMY